MNLAILKKNYYLKQKLVLFFVLLLYTSSNRFVISYLIQPSTPNHVNLLNIAISLSNRVFNCLKQNCIIVNAEIQVYRNIFVNTNWKRVNITNNLISFVLYNILFVLFYLCSLACF